MLVRDLRILLPGLASLVGCATSAPELGVVGQGATVTPVALEPPPASNPSLPVSTNLSVADNGRVVLLSHRFVTRVDHAGHVLAPAPRIEVPYIADPDVTPAQPALASVIRPFGTGFLSVWTQGNQRWLRRLDEDGAPRPEPSVAISSPVADASCDAAGCLLVFGSGALTYRRLGADGALVEAAALPLASNAIQPAVATAAGAWLVAWTDSSGGSNAFDVRVARVSRAGVVLDPGGRTISTAALQRSTPAVASDGTSFFVAWVARSGFGSRPAGCYGILLGPDGTPLTATLFLGEGADAGGASPASVAFDGTRYVVTWSRPDTTPVVRVSRAGALLDATPMTFPGTVLNARVVASGGDTFLATSAGTVGGRWLRASGSADAALTGLADYPNAEGPPLVAWSGRDFFVERTERAVDPTLILNETTRAEAYRLVTEDGTARTPWTPLSFAFTAATSDGARLHLIRSAPDRLNVSQYYFLAADGSLTARAGDLTLISPRGAPADGLIGVTTVGNVVSGVTAPYAEFRRIAASGAVLDPTPLRVLGDSAASAFDGAHWFVVLAGSLYRISAAGELVSGPTALGANTRSAACGGGACVFTAVTSRGGSAIVVASDGRVRGTLDLVTTPAGAPDRGVAGGEVTYDGREFVVTLRTTTPASLVAYRVRPDATVVDPAGQAIFANPYDMVDCAQASSPHARTLIACRGWDRGWPVRRLYAALLRNDADAGTPPTDAGGMDVVDAADVPAVDATTPDAPISDVSATDASADVLAIDAGTPIVDAGTPIVDTGTSIVDTGTSIVDTGTPIVDAGTPIVDAGAPGADAATGGPDAGASPAVDGSCSVGGAGRSGHGRLPAGGVVGLAALALLSRRRRR